MPVVGKVYGHVPVLVEQANIDLDTDIIHVALFDDVHAFDVTDIQWSDIKINEAVGAGYTSGGIEITHAAPGTKLDHDAATGIYAFGKLAEDSEWANSTITAHHAVVYVFTDTVAPGVPDDGCLLLCSIDFDGAEVTLNTPFIITWPATGIFRFRPNP